MNKIIFQLYIYECASLLLLELPEESSMFTRCSPGPWLFFGFGGMWVWIALCCCIGHFCCHVYSNEETTLPEERQGKIILVPAMPHLHHPQGSACFCKKMSTFCKH